MALTLSEIQAITDDSWLPGSHVQWSMGNVMMYKMLGKAEKIGSAEKVRVILEYAKARGGAMGASTRFETAKKEVINAAKFPWAMFWAGATYDIDDEVQVSGGDNGIDIVFTKLDNAQRTIRDIMGDSFWTLYAAAQTTYGTETKPFYGLADLMNQSDTTPKFGAIAQADLGTFTREGSSANIWQAYSSSTALTMNFQTMQILRRNCSVGNGVDDKPDMYLTTEALKDAFENSLQAAQRHSDSDLVKAGFDNIMFGSRGAVVPDDKCPASSVQGLNVTKLHLKAHKDFLFPGPIWKSPTDQHVKTTQIEFVGSFVTTERRAHGQLTAVS